ncbi:MAG TPA: hypothetical protein VEV16_06580, partial [Daejeonella sp.]|nr:hypothetical protein [Daejeonella sp.]
MDRQICFYRFLLIALCWQGIFNVPAFALIKKSQISGNWTNVNTWGGISPLPGDEVIISSGTTVNLNQVTADILGGLTIELGATLIITVNESGLKVSGNIANHGTLTTWIHQGLKGTLSLHGNSYWSGQGSWNLGAIHINEHNWEFDEGLVIRIADNISGSPGSSMNKNYRRTATIFHFNGSENAVLLADGSSYYYPSIIVDKPEFVDKLDQKKVSFLDSYSPNMVQILGEINILKVTDRLALSPFNSLTVIRNLKGAGELSGSDTSDLIIDGSGDEINPVRMTGGTYFGSIRVLRPAGVAFENSFIVRDELFIAEGSHVRLAKSRLTLGVNGANPTPGNLICRGFLLGGVNGSLAIHGNGALPVELKFAQNNSAEYTIENLDLNRMPGAGPVLMPINHSLVLVGALDIAANNNLVLGNGKLYLNATITINASGYITGSEQASLYVQGHGGNATLRFNQTGSAANRTLQYFYLNRTPGRIITLGNMLNIKQSVNVVSGKLDANSNLTLLSSPSGSASIATISSSATI